MWFCDWTKVEYNCSRDWLYDIGSGLLFDTEIEGHLLPLNNKINCPVEWGLIVLLSVATTWAKKKRKNSATNNFGYNFHEFGQNFNFILSITKSFSQLIALVCICW